MEIFYRLLNRILNWLPPSLGGRTKQTSKVDNQLKLLKFMLGIQHG